MKTEPARSSDSYAPVGDGATGEADLNLPRRLIVALAIFAVATAVLAKAEGNDYPTLHVILDTSIFMVSGILALLLWDMGTRTDQWLPRLLALSFAGAAVFELAHALVGIEWSGRFAEIKQFTEWLRRGTWAPSAYLVPVGIGFALWLGQKDERCTRTFAFVLTGLGAGLLALFLLLPRYVSPGWHGITRPALILVPLLWSGVGYSCRRLHTRDRVAWVLTLTAVILVVAHTAMLFSRTPHDSQSMIAHVGKLISEVFLLLGLTQIGSADTAQRIRAERQLKRLNEELEQRVRERTARLEAINLSHEIEIAARKEAERTVYESQQMLRAIVDNSTAVVYVKDLEGRYLMINRRYEEIFHLTTDAIIGKTDHEIFSKEAADAFRAVDLRVLAAGTVLEMEELAPQVDGLHTYLSIKCPLLDASGKSYAICGISTDITERKQSEIKLRTQFTRLELLNQITRAIGERQDLQSIFQVVVRSLEDQLPIDFGCVCLHNQIGNALTVVSVGGRSEPLATELAMTKQAIIPIDQNGLSRCVRGQLVYEPDISQVPFPFPQRLTRGGLNSLVVAPLLVESKVFGVLVAARREVGGFSSDECEFLRQVSEHAALAAHQAQLYTALQQAYDDLRQSQQTVMQQERLRALGQMASGVAHDINNAISPVSLYVESLLNNEPGLSLRGRSHLETIEHAIDDVAATVARMREFYRQREPQLMLAPVTLNRLVQQVVDLTRARWSDMPQQRGVVIQMKTELAPDLPAIMGVEGEIREALTNLIFNSVDAMPDGGALAVRTGVPASRPDSATSSAPLHVYVEVIDTGVGMNDETRRHCLEPFFTTKGERGTGLGLAMVYGVIQRHSGEIEIESAPGKGTLVRLSFAVSAMASVEPDEPAAPSPIPTGLKILIVDDDPVLLKSISDILETDGHLVVTANGGQAGIDAFLETYVSVQRFAVVITDLGMPYVDGRKVATAVKAASPDTPVILLTGWGQRLVSDGDIPAHVDRVLSKPPKLRDLREALASCTLSLGP